MRPRIIDQSGASIQLKNALKEDGKLLCKKNPGFFFKFYLNKNQNWDYLIFDKLGKSGPEKNVL